MSFLASPVLYMLCTPPHVVSAWPMLFTLFTSFAAATTRARTFLVSVRRSLDDSLLRLHLYLPSWTVVFAVHIVFAVHQVFAVHIVFAVKTNIALGLIKSTRGGGGAT